MEQHNVSAILLAAGRSSRMGCCKQLLPLGRRPAIVHCITSIMSAGISDIIVVVGAEGERVAEAIQHLPVRIARNRDPESDMTASVRIGIGVISKAAGILVALADHPLVLPDTYRFLVLRHREEREKILIPVNSGKKGHPTLFPHHLLTCIPADETLQDIIRARPELVCAVNISDQGVAMDMDTWRDYLDVRKAFYSS